VKRVGCGASTGGEQDDIPKTKLEPTMVRSFFKFMLSSSLKLPFDTNDKGGNFFGDL
jgi:hypothetical protein